MSTKPADRLNQFINEGRLLRWEWVGKDAEGRETACLLAAMSPEVGESRSPDNCPASIMPAWLAHLTPWIDDNCSVEKWPETIRKYADLARRWHVLTPEAWSRAEYRVKRVCVLEAMSHTKEATALTVCSRVVALLDRAIAGDIPSKTEWSAAAEARAAASAAWAAAVAAEAVAEAAVAAVAAAEARAAASAAWAAADRIILGIFDVLEDEVTR